MEDSIKKEIEQLKMQKKLLKVFLQEKLEDLSTNQKNIVILWICIEFTNYCKNDCYYCGICCSNAKAERYRLSKEDIIACCREGFVFVNI